MTKFGILDALGDPRYVGWVNPPIFNGKDIFDTNTGLIGAGIDPDADLTPSGSISTTSNGQLIEMLDIDGRIEVLHDDVLIRYCRIRNENTAHPVDIKGVVGGTNVMWCEMSQSLTTGGNRNGVNLSGNSNQAGKNRHQVYRCHMHHVADGVRLSNGITVAESFIDINAPQYTDPESGPTHSDGMQCQKAPPTHDPSVEVLRNKIRGGQWFGNAGLYFVAIGADIANIVIDNNEIWHVNKGIFLAGEHASATHEFIGTATITNNRIVQGWNDPGDPLFDIPIDDNSGIIVRSGNVAVDTSGNVLGSLDP